MTRKEYYELRNAVHGGQADAFDVFDAVIDLYFDSLELQAKIEELNGRVHELEATLDGRN